ncbi:MAG: hypothetical protein KQA41_02960 [Candidatus Aenigmarchaeota archaeon]|nr:hypothetical protein [Candidatus Aenigmarchaeota archaeon]MBU5689161.1 hypothetical protein [Candidatus Aenigmarchaeota archaeon]
MKCTRCHSQRVVTFLDFFGNRRAFCRSCHESILLEEVQLTQKKLSEFAEYYRGGWFGKHDIVGKLSV